MDAKSKAKELTDAFTALDNARNGFTGELILAANQALGIEVFKEAGYVRDSQGIVIRLCARIPCDNDSGFWDVG